MRETDEINKVKNKLPRWNNNPNQINTTILTRFLSFKTDRVSVDDLAKKCNDIGDFQGNYNQMKNFGEKNHGKVFEENRGQISLWEPIKDEVYKVFKSHNEDTQPNGEDKMSNDNKETNEQSKAKESMKTQSLNQILFGPPGTGKTYNTINKALEIIDGEVPSERIKAKERFEELKKAGQIEFVTFHQSYGYEEFVEGIKAKSDNGTLSYDVESGIFKKLLRLATENFENSKKTKVEVKQEKSLKQKLERFLNDALEKETEFFKTKGGKFRIIEISKDEITIFAEDSKYSDNHLQMKFDELFKVVNYKNKLTSSKQLSKEVFNEVYQKQKDTYYLSMYNEFKKLPFYNIEGIKNDEKQPIENYILIIDEINRGNISKIFGELITLIEPSKRIGADEEIRVRLPYSGDDFGVPSNLYIIGTMNTADRSIALMDTALRRRFEFVEMLPDLETLNGLVVENINIKSMLETINKRVEYLYDRDHTIGHAYFIDIKTKDDLDGVMRNKVIPLLSEYFYDDWEKILMVLGDGFVEKVVLKDDIFDYIVDDYLEDEKYVYTIKKDFDYSKFTK